LLQRDWLGAWPRRFTSNIQYISSLGHHLFGMMEGRFFLDKPASVRKRIGGDVEYAHDQTRSTQIHRATTELPEHIAHSPPKPPIGKCFYVLTCQQLDITGRQTSSARVWHRYRPMLTAALESVRFVGAVKGCRARAGTAARDRAAGIQKTEFTTPNSISTNAVQAG